MITKMSPRCLLVSMHKDGYELLWSLIWYELISDLGPVKDVCETHAQT